MTLAPLLALALAAAAPGVDLPMPPVGRWATMPRLVYRPDYKPRAIWVDRAQALEGSDGCTLPAPDAEGIVRLNVPFAVRLSPKGAVEDAHADMPGCPALAALIEQFAGQLGPKTLVSPGGTPPIWRASHFLAGWRK